jgi:hypothetical protein
LLLLAVIAWACGGGGDASTSGESRVCEERPTSPASEGDNLFVNGGFEDGTDPWCHLKPPPFTTAGVARDGDASAFLDFSATLDETDNKIGYLVQELDLHELPEVVSGDYRVENWEKGTEKQYLQFVVIVFGGDSPPQDFANHQIRYILAGIKSPPFAISNAQFVFLTREDPVQGEWVHFERNLREDFEKFWGKVPTNFDKIRFLFEVRYDDKKAGEGPVNADVYYDNLYIGPAP